MTLPHPLPEDLVELIARRFRVMGEPTRIRLLDHLRDGEQSVNDLTACVGASQQNVSKQLAMLADAGILARRKDGNHVYYRIADGGVLQLCEHVCGSLDAQLQALAALVATAVPRAAGPTPAPSRSRPAPARLTPRLRTP